MNKKELNNEIILCRPAVRKAKVVVIRKILKKMKILKSCKIETVKEKKLKKSERLFKKVQIMKKVKDDDVTKFALRNRDLEVYLQGPKVHLKKSALASLAKHEAVTRKINSIKERIPNWETELPILLDSLGKKKHSSQCGVAKAASKTEKQEDKKSEEKSDFVIEKSQKSDACKKETVVKPAFRSSRNLKVSKNNKEEKIGGENIDDSLAGDTFSNSPETEKIEDPFFVEKKVIAPKLLTESAPNWKNSSKREKLKRESITSEFHMKPFKVKKESNQYKTEKSLAELSEEKLHPSWAAKKVKLIKPFEGKKIVFSEE